MTASDLLRGSFVLLSTIRIHKVKVSYLDTVKILHRYSYRQITRKPLPIKGEALGSGTEIIARSGVKP